MPWLVPDRISPPRIALYSHDTMGLGHIRRNQLIAAALAAQPMGATVLLLSGSREGGAFEIPPGVDSVVLPAYRKESNGGYASKSLRVGVGELVNLRSDLIDQALRHFEPHLFIVDKAPAGALGELKPALTRLRRSGTTHCVLGLRDILDDPESVRREWTELDNFQTVRNFYDAVWVYGDEQVFPAMAAYGFPADICQKTTYMGYLDPYHASALRTQPLVASADFRPTAICAVGGGQDGYELARNFVAARMPPDMRGLVVTGPMMPREQQATLMSTVAGRADLQIVQGVHDLVPLLATAGRVVAMAGYNTVNEALASGLPVLLVPRSAPRKEQLIRAERLQALGLASCISAETITPEAITAWLAAPAARTDARALIDYGGLDRIVGECLAVMASRFPCPSGHLPALAASASRA